MTNATTSAPQRLLRILFRGTEIDVQCAENGFIHLVTRTHKKHGGPCARLLQHLAHAAWRTGDLLYARHNNGLPWVIERVVLGQTADDGKPDWAGTANFISRLPMHLANGDTSYQWLFPNEGIENLELGLLSARSAGFSEHVCEFFPVDIDRLNKGTGRVHVIPDGCDICIDPEDAASAPEAAGKKHSRNQQKDPA